MPDGIHGCPISHWVKVLAVQKPDISPWNKKPHHGDGAFCDEKGMDNYLMG